jgi:hypothetical protein
VASTRPTGRVDPLSRPEAQWCKATSGWSIPDRFAFFAFQITIDYDCLEWFPGLEVQWQETELFVGGTVDKWSNAAYALLKSSSSHDCCTIYRTVHTTLSDFGYTLRGTKSTNHESFFLL